MAFETISFASLDTAAGPSILTTLVWTGCRVAHMVRRLAR
jgi:hypothetical protein